MVRPDRDSYDKWSPHFLYLYQRSTNQNVFANVKYCVKNNIVVESNAYKVSEDEHFVGATVTEPRAGLYKSILPFDFASLYPSIIMAHNIDMSKLVDDRNGINENIPDELCNVIAWPEHLNCKCPLDPKRDSKREQKEKMVKLNESVLVIVIAS